MIGSRPACAQVHGGARLLLRHLHTRQRRGRVRRLRGEVLGVQAYNGQQSGSDTAPTTTRVDRHPAAGHTDLLFSGRQLADRESGSTPTRWARSRAASQGRLLRCSDAQRAEIELAEVPEETECVRLARRACRSVRYESQREGLHHGIGDRNAAVCRPYYTKDGCTGPTAWPPSTIGIL